MSKENNKDEFKETPMVDNQEEFENENIIENVEDLDKKFRNSMNEINKKTDVKKTYTTKKFIVSLAAMFVVLIPLVSYIAYDQAIAQVDMEHKTIFEKWTEKKVPEEQLTEYRPTVINVGYNKNSATLTYDIEQASVKLEKYFINIGKDTLNKWLNTELNLDKDSFDSSNEQPGKQFWIRSIDSYNNFLYINYLNETGTAARDVIVSDHIFKAGLPINDMVSLDDRLYESADDTTVMSFVESYNDSFIFYSEATGTGKLATKTLSNRINETESEFTYTKIEDVTEENVIINLEGVGALELGKLTNLKEAPGTYLSTQDGVLRLYNYVDEEAYAFITYINNVNFMCEASDLLNTNYDNLFICDGFDDKESIGYRTFAIKGKDDQLYVFRVLEFADEQLLVDILKTFGIEKDKIEVQVIQESVDVEHVDGVNEEGAESIFEAETSETIENTEELENTEDVEDESTKPENTDPEVEDDTKSED